MKTVLKKNVLLLFAIIMQSTYFFSQSYCDSNPVDIHGSLSISGNKIVDQNNAAVSFAGNSMFWSNTNFNAEPFYNANVVSWLKSDWNTTIVRAAMGVENFGGFLSDTSNRDRVITIVDAALAEGLYVIIDWHTHHAESNQQQAIDFFRDMATLYGNHPNIIYEIYNEPIDSDWSNDIKPYAEAVISEIRAIDPDNLIIVGTPFFSQEVDIASNDPITSSTNIAYTLHFYAGTHGAELRAKAQTALNNGIALMVTEWGTVNADGNGAVNNNSTDEWMAFLAENDITHLNWSVNDKAEGASIVNPGANPNGNWSASDLTASGKKVKSIVENWAQYCDGEPIVIETPVVEYTDIPSRIEAEDYTSHSGTQLEDTADVDGNLNVGYIDTNDSLTYNINAATAGTYTIDFRIASRTAGTNFDIYSGDTVIGNISSDATDGWQNWETATTSVSLNSGNQTIRLVATGNGWNINWLKFSEGEQTQEEEEEEEEEQEEEQEETNNNSSNCSAIQTWSPSTIYPDAGTRVVYENIIYENKWYTLNQNPITFSVNSWDLWTLIGSCTSGKSSVQKTLIDENIHFFQNSTGNLSIYIDDIESYSKATIFDVQGQAITSKQITQNTSEVSLQGYSVGIYFLRLSGKKSFSKSFIKK